MNTNPDELAEFPTIRIVHQSGDGSPSTWHTLTSDGVYTIETDAPTDIDAADNGAP